MRMSDFVVRDAIVPDLTATNKEGVIREMVESLRAAGQFRGRDPEDIVRAILKRELLGSTGIGRGVAIPHTKHNSVERLIGTVAVSNKGVAFDSLDGEPVHVFVLLISPQDRPGDHLRALENVSRTPARRRFRPRPARGQDAGRNPRPARQGRPLTAVAVARRPSKLLDSRTCVRGVLGLMMDCHERRAPAAKRWSSPTRKGSTCARWRPSRSWRRASRAASRSAAKDRASTARASSTSCCWPPSRGPS